MTLKKQLQTIKDNWLIALIAIFLLFSVMDGSDLLDGSYSKLSSVSGGYGGMARDSYAGAPMMESAMYSRGIAPP